MSFFGFFNTCCTDDSDDEIIDWTGSSEKIVEGTLRREHLLVKLQELEDSESSDSAEAALKAMDEAVSEDDDLVLRWMQKAGTPTIIHQVLTRDQDRRPSPVAAASLLSKFDKHPMRKTKLASNRHTQRLRRESDINRLGRQQQQQQQQQVRQR